MANTIEKNITEICYTLYPMAYKFCKDTDVAQDIVQDTILKALINIAKYKEGTNLKGWLYTIMRNIFINEYRRRKRFCFVESATDFDIIGGQNQASYNEGSSNLGKAEIDMQLSRLDKKLTHPFLMHFEGFKYEEIAQELQLPIGTVKNRIHIARKELQEKIQLSGMSVAVA